VAWDHSKVREQGRTNKTAAPPSFKLTVIAFCGWLMVTHKDDVYQPLGWVLRTSHGETSII